MCPDTYYYNCYHLETHLDPCSKSVAQVNLFADKFESNLSKVFNVGKKMLNTWQIDQILNMLATKIWSCIALNVSTKTKNMAWSLLSKSKKKTAAATIFIPTNLSFPLFCLSVSLSLCVSPSPPPHLSKCILNSQPNTPFLFFFAL